MMWGGGTWGGGMRIHEFLVGGRYRVAVSVSRIESMRVYTLV